MLPVDELFMERCLQLARLGEGLVAPNPLVGCVIVSDGFIVGEGYHRAFGLSHAEVMAINSVKDKKLLADCTLYVNLEPCAHFGKTPPCVDLILKHKIPRVVIGCRDPFEFVNGKGAEMLEQHQVTVRMGILESDCRYLNRRFLTFHERKRPFVLLKFAQSQDGFIGILEGPVAISNARSKQLVHKERSRVMGILAGTNTVAVDNPRLTVREWFGQDPLRIILDRKFRLPKTLSVFDHSVPTLVFTDNNCVNEKNMRFLKLDTDQFIPDVLLVKLFELGIQSILVEGGAALIKSFLDQNCWDEAMVITGSKQLGHGIEAPKVANKTPVGFNLGGDHIVMFYNTSIPST